MSKFIYNTQIKIIQIFKHKNGIKAVPRALLTFERGCELEDKISHANMRIPYLRYKSRSFRS